MNVLRRVVERAYWTAVRQLYTSRVINGMPFVYLTARGGRLLEELSPVLEQALERVIVAGPAYKSVVFENLRFVAAANVRRDYVSVAARGYVSAFRSNEAISSHYLASNLVWAAEFIRWCRGQGQLDGNLDAYRSAKAMQVSFVRQFADSEIWIAFIEQHGHQFSES